MMFCGADLGWFCWNSSFFWFSFWMIFFGMILDDFQAQGRDWCGGGSSFAGKAVAAGRSGVPGRIGSTSKRRQCSTPLKKKRVQHRWFQQFSKEVQQQFPFSMFHHFILQFCTSFPSRRVRRPGGKGGGTDPGHCLVEAGIKRWDQKIWWMGWSIWKIDGTSGICGYPWLWQPITLIMGFQ